MVSKEDIKASLPLLVIESGLFRDEGEKRRFSPVSGGVFRCPVCGGKLGLFVKRKGYKDHFGITSFGTCPHFGHGGVYSNDTFGMYAALHGVDEKQAFATLMAQDGSSVEHGRWEMVCRQDEEMKARGLSENIARCSGLEYGRQLGEAGRRLLALRSIDLDRLPEHTAACIAYAPAGTKLLSRGGRWFDAEGLVFRNGDVFQIRRTRGDSYAPKGRARFISVGGGALFNSSHIEPASPLFVSEGPFDVLSLQIAGAVNSIGTMGAGNNLSRIGEVVPALSSGEPVFICFDPDNAGENGAHRLLEELRGCGHEVFIYPVAGGAHDANDALTSGSAILPARVRIANALAKRLASGRMDGVAIRRVISGLCQEDAGHKPGYTARLVEFFTERGEI